MPPQWRQYVNNNCCYYYDFFHPTQRSHFAVTTPVLPSTPQKALCARSHIKQIITTILNKSIYNHHQKNQHSSLYRSMDGSIEEVLEMQYHCTISHSTQQLCVVAVDATPLTKYACLPAIYNRVPIMPTHLRPPYTKSITLEFHIFSLQLFNIDSNFEL